MIKKPGIPAQRSSILQKQRNHLSRKISETDGGKGGPAEAGGSHLTAAVDIVKYHPGVLDVESVLLDPLAQTFFFIRVGAVADIRIFCRIAVGVLAAADKADRFGGEENPSFLLGIFPAEDRERKFSLGKLPEQRLAVTGRDTDIDLRILFRVKAHNTGKTVAAVIDGSTDG